jgi:hypothetical protein
MMKLASTCPNSDMGVVWGLLCLHLNTIKPRYYGSQTKFVRHITFAQFLIIIIIINIIIMAPKRTFFFVRHITFAQFLIIIIAPKRSLWDILLLLCFLLHHPDYCRVMYCYSTFLFHYYYYVTQNAVGWRIAILRFFFTIIIIIIIIIVLLHIFVRSISQRCLDQTLWNLVGISYAMWSCAV